MGDPRKTKGCALSDRCWKSPPHEAKRSGAGRIRPQAGHTIFAVTAGSQRLSPETRQLPPKIQKIGRQRLHNVSQQRRRANP